MKPRRLSWFSRPPRWARFVLYAVAIGFIVWAWIPNWSDLSSSEAPVIIKKPGEPDSYNVTVGDVVVNLLGSAPRDHRPHADYLRIAVERDPRFHFARSLDALLVYLSESPDIPRQISRYEELLKGAEPQPALYPAAPPNSTVFSPGDLRDSAEVI